MTGSTNFPEALLQARAETLYQTRAAARFESRKLVFIHGFGSVFASERLRLDRDLLLQS